MADHPGRTFQKWQCRLPEEGKNKLAPGEKTEKQRLLEFMCAFRETFSRPVKPIRFLGLFDTVNSVPAFENAWMQRSKFPYTARSTARVIRHAVSIDERRAKFRQDLISQAKPDKSMIYKRHHRRKHAKRHHQGADTSGNEKIDGEERGRRATLAVPERFRDPHETSGIRSLSADYSQCDGSSRSRSRAESIMSFGVHNTWQSDEMEGEQDIQEVWFPGCHAVRTQNPCQNVSEIDKHRTLAVAGPSTKVMMLRSVTFHSYGWCVKPQNPASTSMRRRWTRYIAGTMKMNFLPPNLR